MTGIGTDVGKTVVSSILSKALGYYYWKPVQAGIFPYTDSGNIQEWLGLPERIFPEVYVLQMPASPHIAAPAEGVALSIETIMDAYRTQVLPATEGKVVMEGAGGLLVHLNRTESFADLILAMNARVVLVSRNYLGSFSHSLLTAEVCRHRGLDVAGWVFNDESIGYEEDLERITGYPALARIDKATVLDGRFIEEQANIWGDRLRNLLT